MELARAFSPPATQPALAGWLEGLALLAAAAAAAAAAIESI